MVSYGFEHSYNKFIGRKVKDQLCAFLLNLPGNIDALGDQDNSSLRSLIEKSPFGAKELVTLTAARLVDFSLHPGPLPEHYRMMSQQPQRKKRKHKKHKHKMGDTPNHESQQQANASDASHERKKKTQEAEAPWTKRKNGRKRRKKKEVSQLKPFHHSYVDSALFQVRPSISYRQSTTAICEELQAETASDDSSVNENDKGPATEPSDPSPSDNVHVALHRRDRPRRLVRKPQWLQDYHF
ncbi:hypothetical protein HPB49_022816 [Dermacentor silvarum]|uniref:Uncharacterized protein n=1 Tax=Dermacentor silvarum TaxID=543639 RepID=A0ACB8D034_DERSI|nr:hypothetical protein HPB49_022816 [Dermacentor silvarum]